MKWLLTSVLAVAAIVGVPTSIKFAKDQVEQTKRAFVGEPTPEDKVAEMKALLRRQARNIAQLELRIQKVKEIADTTKDQRFVNILASLTKHAETMTARHTEQLKAISVMECELDLLQVRQNATFGTDVDISDSIRKINDQLKALSDDVYSGNREIDLLTATPNGN